MIGIRLIMSASWWFVARLQELSGGAFFVAEEHDHMLDTISLYHGEDHGQPVISFNRPGPLHIFRTLDGSRIMHTDGYDWYVRNIWKMLLDGYPLDFIINEITLFARLKLEDPLPPLFPQALVFKTISSIMIANLFEKDQYGCRSGFSHGAHPGSEIWDAYFKPFTAANEKMRSFLPSKGWHHPAKDFWFLLRACEPILCLETCGIVHTRDGKAFDLMKLYKKKNGNILGVISEIMGVK